MKSFVYRMWINFRPTRVKKNAKTLRIGILGAANIAPMAVILPAMKNPNVEIVAVAARDPAKAAAFAKKWSIPKVHNTYQDLINDKDIDAIYNPLPNSHHYEWTMKSMENGKHVLLEKPFTSNAKEAVELVNKSKEKKVVLVEAFHWRYHPFAKRCLTLCRELGKIKHISVKFQIPEFVVMKLWKNDIRTNYSLAGGVAMDMGCYTINIMREFVGEEPEEISAVPTKLVRPEIDAGMIGNFKFPSGATGKITCGGGAEFSSITDLNKVEITAEKGKMIIIGIIGPYAYNKVTIIKDGISRSEKVYADGNSTYSYQLEAFYQQVQSPSSKICIPIENSIANMKVLDGLYSAAGLKVRGT